MKRTILEAGGAILAVVVWLHLHDGKVRADARADAIADSLRRAAAHLDSAIAATLAHRRADSILEVRRLAALSARDAELQRSRLQSDSLLATLRLGASARTRLLLDSLSAFHARREGILMDQRDSAIALFRGAAAQRDTLAGLLAESQAQRRSLMTALIEARKQPLWDKPVIRWGSLAVAYVLGRLR